MVLCGTLLPIPIWLNAGCDRSQGQILSPKCLLTKSIDMMYIWQVMIWLFFGFAVVKYLSSVRMIQQASVDIVWSKIDEDLYGMDILTYGESCCSQSSAQIHGGLLGQLTPSIHTNTHSLTALT